MAIGLILVTGGTGGLGRRVVARLREAGREVRVLSRRVHDNAEGVEYMTGDLVKDEGIEVAVEGVEVIVHCAGSPRIEAEKSQVRNLTRAASRVGTRHVLYISVVGADRIPVNGRLDRAMFGYFASKIESEQILAASGLPWTILRATQFHDGFVLVTLRAMAKLPVIPVPAGIRFQPIDAGEVAARFAELALGPPAGLVPDMAGPKVYELAELLRLYLRAFGKRRALVPVTIPGKAARAIRAGANLAPERAVGQRTFEEFLAERVSAINPPRAEARNPSR